jgi:hypothetical protein
MAVAGQLYRAVKELKLLMFPGNSSVSSHYPPLSERDRRCELCSKGRSRRFRACKRVSFIGRLPLTGVLAPQCTCVRACVRACCRLIDCWNTGPRAALLRSGMPSSSLFYVRGRREVDEASGLIEVLTLTFILACSIV